MAEWIRYNGFVQEFGNVHFQHDSNKISQHISWNDPISRAILFKDCKCFQNDFLEKHYMRIYPGNKNTVYFNGIYNGIVFLLICPPLLTSNTVVLCWVDLFTNVLTTISFRKRERERESIFRKDRLNIVNQKIVNQKLVL